MPGCMAVKSIENTVVCWGASVTGVARPTGPSNPLPTTVKVEIVSDAVACADVDWFSSWKSQTFNCPAATCPKSYVLEKAAPELAVVPVQDGSTVSAGARLAEARRIRLTLFTCRLPL